jgi:hypothetical protein
MVLATPKFVKTKPVDVIDEVEVSAELQHRMLADRVMRGKKGAKS